MLARRIAAGLLVVLAWGLAAKSAGGPTRVPADPWLTAAAVVAALTLIPVAVKRTRWTRWAIPAALLVLSVLACQIHLGEGFPRTHDGRLHLWSMWSLHRCILDGDLLPRWNPYLGLGYPLLQYYPPSTYAAAQPLMALGLSPVRAAAVLVVIFSWGSGLSMFGSARRLGLGRLPGLAAAAAVILAPYHLFDANFRFALAELAAFVLVPPFLVLGREVAWGGKDRVPWRGFVAVAVGLLLTHLLSALMAGICLGIWIVAELILGRWREYRAVAIGLGRTAAACLLAAALVGAFLVPALLEIRHTSIERYLPADPSPLSSHGIALPDLAERYGWTKYSARRSRPAEGEDPNHLIPFYFGLALLGAAMAAVVLGVGRRSTPDPTARYGSLFLALVCCLLFSAGIPAPFLDHFPGMDSLQFPWRFLGPAVVLAALLGGAAIHLAAPGPRARAALAALFIVALVVDAWPYLGACDWHDPYRGASHQHWVEDAPTFAERYEPIDAEIPADEFVRVELLRFPPADWTHRVAQAHQSHREFLTPEIYENYLVAAARPADRALSEHHGVSRRYRPARRRPIQYEPDPMAALHTPDGAVLALDDLQILPERLTVELPSEHPGGRLRVLFQAFPGWRVRTDGGAWAPAGSDEGFLSAAIPPGASTVELHYSLRTAPRIAGLVVSSVAWSAVLGLWIRRRARITSRSA